MVDDGSGGGDDGGDCLRGIQNREVKAKFNYEPIALWKQVV